MNYQRRAHTGQRLVLHIIIILLKNVAPSYMELVLLGAIMIVLLVIGVLIFNQPMHKTAIVSLVKDPHAFETWITYHKEKMKIDKFYVFLDDESENLGIEDPALEVHRDWKNRLGFEFNDKIDEPANVRVKQQLVTEEGARLAAKDGIKYLVHIDSDELLYGPKPISQVFSNYPADAFHMKNSELAPDRKDYKNCFMEGTWFHGDPTKFIAYGNGKGAGVVGQSMPHGPHNFKGSRVVEVPEDELKVLHYPSCNIDETLKRAKNYGKFQDNSAGWSEHHKETRDVLTACGNDCKEKAEAQFEKRMAGPDAYKVDLGL